MPPATITRGTIRTNIQRRIGDTASTQFYTTALLNQLIDSRVLSQQGEIARLAPNYYLAHASYTGVDDATDVTYEFYNYPADFGIFVKLERQFGTGLNVVYQTMRKVNAEDQDRYRIGFNLVLLLPDSMQNFQQTVADWDTRFRLIPPPQNNSFLYRLRYLRRPVAATADESILDIPLEWHDFIELDCAMHILATTGDPIMNIMKELRDQEYQLMKRRFRRHYFGSAGIDTLDNMSGAY